MKVDESQYNANSGVDAERTISACFGFGWSDSEDKLKLIFKRLSLDDPFHPGEADHTYILGQFALIHSEVSEAVEAYRRDLMDDKLPHRKGVEVELADVVIRCIKLSNHWGLDLAGAIVEKEQFNRTRKDHLLENRSKPGGKRF